MSLPKKIVIESQTITIRPRYSETDQGGVVHHSVYPVWLEMGRTELLRANGLAYKDMERAGFYFVVVELSLKYRRPCRYDEDVRLTTTCSAMTAAKIEHTYKLTNSRGVVLAQGLTKIACVDDSGKVRRVPEFNV